MPQKTNVCGVISLTLSILSICTSCCFGAGLLFAIPAFILGVIGAARKNMQTGAAIAGIILSIVGIVLSIFILSFWEMLVEYVEQYETAAQTFVIQTLCCR